jgi:hypothetical protein
LRIAITQQLFHMPPDFVVHPRVQIHADHCGGDQRQPQRKLEEVPADVGQSAENGNSFRAWLGTSAFIARRAGELRAHGLVALARRDRCEAPGHGAQTGRRMVDAQARWGQ